MPHWPVNAAADALDGAINKIPWAASMTCRPKHLCGKVARLIALLSQREKFRSLFERRYVNGQCEPDHGFDWLFLLQNRWRREDHLNLIALMARLVAAGVLSNKQRAMLGTLVRALEHPERYESYSAKDKAKLREVELKVAALWILCAGPNALRDLVLYSESWWTGKSAPAPARRGV
ncbi:hypothetical protein BDV19DRAFT_392171 [Aspergillus venezuelensis]